MSFSNDPISILIRATELFNDLPFNTFMIELETSDGLYTLEKANPMVWAIENDGNDTKYIINQNLITHFYRHFIKRIGIRKLSTSDVIDLYQQN